MNDKVIASLATIPSRTHHLQTVVNSIINQVDFLYVFLNNYQNIPDFLYQDKIQFFTSQEFGDKGDINKFYPLQNKEGYLLALDDDLAYPEDYIKTMVQKIDHYQRSAFICVHGNIVPQKMLNSYYQEKKGVHYMRKLNKDMPVDVPGTGTLAYHSSIYNVNINDFKYPNMMDIWLFKIARERNIPVISIERKDKWIMPLILHQDDESIYAKFINNDSLPTKIINNILRGDYGYFKE